MCATVTRAVIHALAFNESSTYGVNGVDEIDTSHIRRHWLARKKCDSHLARRHASLKSTVTDRFGFQGSTSMPRGDYWLQIWGKGSEKL